MRIQCFFLILFIVWFLLLFFYKLLTNICLQCVTLTKAETYIHIYIKEMENLAMIHKQI